MEGAVAAAVLAQTGAGLRDVARAATGTTPATGAFPAVRGYARRATLTNPDGLHARPAAEFVKLAVRKECRVFIQDLSHRTPAASCHIQSDQFRDSESIGMTKLRAHTQK